MTALPRKAKEFVSAIISYFERERDNRGPLLPLTAVREVTLYNKNSNIN